MNIFRFIADMLHLAAILLLLYRIKNTRNCVGKFFNTRKPGKYPSFSFWWFLTLKNRYIMQDARNIPNRVLCALPWPFHVLRQFVQHYHENILYHSNCSHNILDASSKALLHNLWLVGRCIPTFESSNSSSTCFDFHYSRRRHILGICMVILTLARITCFCSANSNVKQNQNYRKHDKSLRCMSWTLPLLLHS